MERYTKLQRVCNIDQGDITVVSDNLDTSEMVSSAMFCQLRQSIRRLGFKAEIIYLHVQTQYILKRTFLENREWSLVAPENEALLLESINHPNIIKLIDHFYHNEAFCLVMELAEQGQPSSQLASQRDLTIPSLLLSSFNEVVS